MSMKHYYELVTAAAHLDWPSHYKGDLTEHDKAACEARSDTTPFAWSIRECGTHLIYVDCQDDADWALACSRNGGDRAYYFIWTGHELQKVKRAAWDEFIRSSAASLPQWRFTVRITAAWSRPYSETYTFRAKDETTARKLLDWHLSRLANSETTEIIDGGMVEESRGTRIGNTPARLIAHAS